MASIEEIQAKYVVVGGGIAGVTCTETLYSLCPDEDILLLTSTKLIKAITNYQKMTHALESFDVEERAMASVQKGCPNVRVIQKTVASLNAKEHVLTTTDGTKIYYKKLCLCAGGKPKLIAKDNPFVLGIRDTESVQQFQKRLHRARRILVVGNGGIATELVYEIEGCEVIWAIKDKSISSTFVDAGAAAFFLPHLNEDKDHTVKLSKRLKYTEEPATESQQSTTESPGGALGPDWSSNLQMQGAEKTSHHVHVEYEVEVKRFLSPEELLTEGKTETCEPMLSQDTGQAWSVYVELTNGKVYGCDFVVSATGVSPNIKPFSQGNTFNTADDGGICVDKEMKTSEPDVYAAGDVCHASWEPAPHWLQMRLWSQARQMGAYAAKCMVAHNREEEIHMDFCFELFAHVSKFFNYKVILLGKYNAQGLGSDHELLLRVTKGQEFVKVVIQHGRLQGAILIGETDLEETFENLILNQIDLTPFKEHLLDSSIDIEDFFD